MHFAHKHRFSWRRVGVAFGLLGLVASAAGGGYLLGQHHLVLRSREPNVIVSGQKYSDIAPERRTRVEIPVEFHIGMKSGPSLLTVQCGDYIMARVSSHDRNTSLVLWYDEATAPLPQALTLQLWEGNGALQVVTVDGVDLCRAGKIVCGGGISLQPQVQTLRWNDVKPASVARIGREWGWNTTPPDGHEISVLRGRFNEFNDLYVTIIDAPSVRQHQQLQVSRKNEQATIQVLIEPDSYLAHQYCMFVVGSRWGNLPDYAFRIKGQDLLNLTSMVIDEPNSAEPKHMVHFTPEVPADFWVLDGGSQ